MVKMVRYGWYLLMEFIKMGKFINDNVSKQNMEVFSDISCEEWILLFLRCNNNQPINGRLMFVKMLFVADKEIFQGELNKKFIFYPDKHGPYSKLFPQCLSNLKETRLITEQEIRYDFSSSYEYKITPQGVEIINPKLSLINPEILKRLEALKSAFLSQGHKKVLRYVYQKYPEYTTSSIIKDDVKNANYY